MGQQWEAALRQRDEAEAEVKRLSAQLQTFPTGAMGLTPDAVKFSPEYREIKGAYDRAFSRLRKLNSMIARVRKSAEIIRKAREKGVSPLDIRFPS